MALPKGITLTKSGKFAISVMRSGKRMKATATDLEKAISIKNEMAAGRYNQSISTGVFRTVNLNQALDDFIAHRVKVSHSKKQTAKRFSWYKKFIGEHFGYNTSLDDISKSDVMMFSDKMNERNFAATTCNYIGSIFYQAQKYAHDRGKMVISPQRVPLRKLTKGRIRFLSQDEEYAALNWYTQACYDDYKDLFLFYLETGCRKSEGFDLQWNDVDLKTKRISIWMTKTNSPRTIKMTPIVHKILANLHFRRPNDQRDTDKVFAHISERKFYRNWLEMRAAIGLEDDEQFVIHMLRHTCCTRLVSAGVDLRSVQEWMGHSSIDMTQRYAHFIPSKLDDAADALQRLRAG